MDAFLQEELQYMRRLVRSRLEQELMNYEQATTYARHEECWGRIAALDQCRSFTTYGRLKQELRWAEGKMGRTAHDLGHKGQFFTGYRDALMDIVMHVERRRTATSSPSLSG